jgi:UDP-N-acetyl-D-glucosamine dehydrogenase
VKRSLGQNFRFVELANDVNDHMPDYVVRRIIETLNRRKQAVNGARILLLGLAYKRNTGDARESPSVALAAQLLSLGAEVRAADPHVVEEHVDRRVVRVEATEAEVAAADLVVIVTDHDAFDYGVVARSARSVLDARARLAVGPNVERL